MQSSSGSSSTSFAVRLVNIDVVSAEPVPGLDSEWCSFESRAVKRVPVIRIFGSTPAGQHCCVHVHNTLPYFFLDFPSDLGEVVTTKEKVYAYIHRLFNSIEAAMDLSLGKAVNREKGQYIHDVQIVRGKPFYGFALSEKFYLKVFIYNPFLLNRMTTLLRNGAIMQTQFQPYEAHIPYLLQFFVDYNLFGMSFVKFSGSKFRLPLPTRRKRVWRNIEYDLAASENASSQWSQQIGSQGLPKRWYCDKSVRDNQISPCVDRRETTCELEVDVVADDIVNYLDRVGTPSSNENRKLVTSLAALWEDETERRRKDGASPLNHSFLEIGEDGKRGTPPETLLAQETRRKLEKIIADEKKYLAQTQGSSPTLKEVPGRNISFSTEQKQQIMSQGPLRQCPSLVDDRDAGHDHPSSGSSPASLFPNTPRANMTFGELQKLGIQRPDAASIAAAAKELYPTASQMPLPDGSFAEPDVDEQMVLSQSASLDEGMVDILNWMQVDEENDGERRADDEVDRDLFEPKNPNGNEGDEDEYLNEARDIEQSQRQIEDDMDEAIQDEKLIADPDFAVQDIPRLEESAPRSEAGQHDRDMPATSLGPSFLEYAEVDMFADSDAFIVTPQHDATPLQSISAAQEDPFVGKKEPPAIYAGGFDPHVAQPVDSPDAPPFRAVSRAPKKPLKSALKKQKPKVKTEVQKLAAKTELKNELDNDEILFTQPEGVGAKLRDRKRKEPPQQIDAPRKRVKFDESVAVFTLSTDSLNFTDKRHVPIFFDDEYPRSITFRALSPQKGSSLVLSYDDVEVEQPPPPLQRSSSSSLLPEDQGIDPSPFAVTPGQEKDAFHVVVDGMDVDHDAMEDGAEEDLLQIEMIRASQSDFHFPQLSPSQPLRDMLAPLESLREPPNPERQSSHERKFPSLVYEDGDEDNTFADMVVGDVLSPPEVAKRESDPTFSPRRLSPHLSAEKSTRDVAAASPTREPAFSGAAPDGSVEEPLLNSQQLSDGEIENDILQSTPPVQQIEVSQRFSQEHLPGRASPNMAALSLISPIKPIHKDKKTSAPSPSPVGNQTNVSLLDDSVPAEQDSFPPQESPIKKISTAQSSHVSLETSLNTQGKEDGRAVVPGLEPLFAQDEKATRSLRVFAFNKKPPTTKLIMKGLQNIGRPFLVYQEPFYGAAEDPARFNQPKDKMIGNKIDLKAFTMASLPQFGRDEFAAPSKLVRVLPPLLTIPGPMGRKLRILTPARAPPSLSRAQEGISVPSTPSAAPASAQPNQDEEDMPASPMAWPGMAHHAPKLSSTKVPSPQKKSAKKHQDASQIEQPTPNNSFGFLFSQGFEPTVANTGESSENQGLTVMSVEVHVNTRGELRPDPKLDAVSCIYLCIRDESIVRAAGHLYRDLLMLLKVRETSNPAEAAKTDSVFDGLAVPRYVRQEYDSEQALLTAFVQVCLEIDPDVIFGYEIQSSSLGYLLDRAQTIKIDLAGNISRLSKHSRSHNSTTSFFDKERDPWGFTHSSGIHVAGRSVVNIWRILRSEIKSTSYTFENTAFHVLHARVPLYTHKTLTNHYNGPASQWRVHLYYLERVQCNLYLLDALNVVGRTSEMARLYGITFFEVLSRGSQFRVESLVMRLTKPHNYILVSPSKQQVAAQLAPECIPLVMEPQSGFYQDPLLVLDFQSLYPSIIIAYNYCYSTCLGRVQPGQGPNNQKKFGASYLSVPHGALDHLKDVLNISPNEVMFLKPEVQVGILPRMLVEILETRVMVKNAMKQAKKDRSLYRLLDARQLALKLLANVTYGYTSASFSGRMPCVDIADAIVQTARETLERAIRTVNSHPTWRARVVYGDTDSMFVLVEGATRERAFEVGNEIADKITSMNPWPVKLKFEKMYLPSLLLAKKRYVGYMYESKEQLNAVFDAKGIETVRRDSCPAVAKIMEKSLTLLFENRDLSEIRTYVQRQFSKMMSGRANLSDFIFRKEVRLGTYAPGKPAPPAALVSTKEMAKDPRAEPQYGERVPYIVAAGHHQARLIDLVFHPDYFLKYPEKLRPNANYYITKQVIPSLSRVFNLIGVDITSWYTSMPKNVRLLQQLQLPGKGGPNAKSRIDQYYLSQHCPICDELTRRGLCDNCSKNKQSSAYILTVRMRHLQQQLHHLNEICVQCQGTRDPTVDCVSLDCAVLFERNKVNIAAATVQSYVQALGQ